MSQFFRKSIKKQHYPTHFSNIKFKTTFRNCVYQALKNRMWTETQNQDWDVLWCQKETINTVFQNHLNSNQKVNHFRFYTELCRKDLLIKNIKKYKKQLQKQNKLQESALVNFIPQTFFLPSQYSIFAQQFKKSVSNQNKVLWIMKPISKCQGKGIFLMSKLNQISLWKNKINPDNPQCQPYIVQKYIMDPLLFGSKKFDMRIYVLVVNYNPLTVYFYRSGFARFTHQPYNDKDIQNLFGHLTNVQIQKGSQNYDQHRGGKWLIDKLKLYLISRYGQQKVNQSFTGIQNIVLKSLLSVQKLITNDKHCFQLYGYDILFDSTLKPWLLEVNGGPSMTANTDFDFQLKCGLLDDVFTIIDVQKVMIGNQEQVGGFDLIYKNGPVKLPSNSEYSCLLGCYNNRRQNLKKLAKNAASRLSQAFELKKQQNKKQQQNNQPKKQIKKKVSTINQGPTKVIVEKKLKQEKNKLQREKFEPFKKQNVEENGEIKKKVMQSIQNHEQQQQQQQE